MLISMVKNAYLVSVNDDFALLLVRAGDEEHVVKRGSVVENGVIFEGIQNITGAKFE